jgi:hypothetical protein
MTPQPLADADIDAVLAYVDAYKPPVIDNKKTGG